jgi:cystathionine beta-lyase
MPVGSETPDADDLDLDVDRLRARRNRKWTHFPGQALPAWIADMDFRAAPPIQHALQHLVSDEDYGYPDRDGDTPDRAIATAFARHERAFHGWEPNPDLIQPLPDLVQGMFTTVLAYTEPDDGVVVPFPAYPPFQAAITETNRKLLPSPMSNDGLRWRLDEEHLRGIARGARMIIVSNPHNPTGHVWEAGELSAIGRVG